MEDLTQQQGLQCRLYIGTLVGFQPIFLSWQSKRQLTMEKIFNSPKFGKYRLRLYICTFVDQNLASPVMRRSPDYIVCVVPLCIFQTTFDDICPSTSSVQVGETKWLSKSGDFVMECTLVNLTTRGVPISPVKGWGHGVVGTNQEAPPVELTNQRQHGSTCRAGFHTELNNFFQV